MTQLGVVAQLNRTGGTQRAAVLPTPGLVRVSRVWLHSVKGESQASTRGTFVDFVQHLKNTS